MWNVNELIMLSDLHLAAERDTGAFQSDRELADCLRWVLTETRDSVIVFAGDMFDFLVAGSCHTNAGFEHFSCHTRQIIEHHPEVFDALADLVRSPKHQLIIMGGDHDSELILPNVQETLERRLGVGLSHPVIRWLVQEEAFRVQVGKATVVVEHGHALDPWNRIDYVTLQESLSLCSRNLFDVSHHKKSQDKKPLGSTLTTTVIRELRSKHHWIDCLKPASERVLPLLWCVVESESQQKDVRRLAEDYLSIKEFAVTKEPGNSHPPASLYRGKKETEHLLKDESFERWNRAINTSPEDDQYDYDSLNDTLLKETRLISGQDDFFDVGQPDDSIKYLKPIFEGGADLVIHGHTHAAKALSVDGGVYINTGTWAQLLPVPKSFEPDNVWRQFLEQLRLNKLSTFRRPTFAYVQHQPSQNVTTATLLEWNQSGPNILNTQQCRN